jgi:DNA-directed RNA polymerase II subunit RPB2
MAFNFVYVFKSKLEKRPWICQIRSVSSTSAGATPAVFSIEMKQFQKDIVLVARIKGIDKDIPLFYLFRALGVYSDKEILECIFYNLDDPQLRDMMEMIRPTMEQAKDINNQNDALEWIGGRIKLDKNDDISTEIM